MHNRQATTSLTILIAALGGEVLVGVLAILCGVFFAATALRGIRVCHSSGEVPPV